MNTPQADLSLSPRGVAPAAAPVEGPSKLGLLGAGHFVVDLCQGVLPLTLPFLLEKLRLGYGGAASLVTVAYLTSSVAQPLFGLGSNPLFARAALLLAPPVACLGLVLVTLAPSYGWALAAVVLSSLGTAMYHPEAAARVHSLRRGDPGRRMSLFVLCGSIGFTTGAMLFGPAFALWGLSGARFLLIPGLLMPLVLWFCGGAAHRAHDGASLPPLGLGRLFRLMAAPVGVMALRQWVVAGTISLVPLYYVSYLGRPPGVGAGMLFSLQLGSNCGVFACGVLGSRFGYRKLVIAGLLVSVAPLLVFPHLEGFWAAAALFCAGAVMAPSMPALTVIGQRLLPGRQALAASLVMGVGVGLGGVASGVFGWIADRWGMPAALGAMGFVPLAAAVLALFIRDTTRE